MKLRHLRGILDKGRYEIDTKHLSAASLEFPDGAVFSIKDVATIGRAPDSNIVVNERSVSRHHARIFHESGHYWLKDLDSANGTMLNGKKIKLQMLGNNDKITFGEAKAFFRTTGQSGPAALGSDPLEGTDDWSQDGTPTDGLPPISSGSEVTTADHISSGQLERNLAATRRQLEEQKKEVESLQRTVEALRSENELLHGALAQKKKSETGSRLIPSTANSSQDLAQENQRLRSLIRQLEKTLADVNLRLRNLQELYDRKSDRESK